MAEEYRKEFIDNRNRMINEMGDGDKEQMMKDFKMPSKEDIMKMLDSMSGMTDEHKEKLREHLLKRSSFDNPFSDGGNAADITPPATSFELITLAIYVIMLISFIAVFGKLLSKNYFTCDEPLSIIETFKTFGDGNWEKAYGGPIIFWSMIDLVIITAMKRLLIGTVIFGNFK